MLSYECVHSTHHLTDAFSFSLFPVVLTSNHVPRVGVTHLCDQCAFATTDIDVLLQHYEACHTLINLKGAHQHVKAEEDVGTNKEGSNKGGAGGEREFSCTKCHFITEVEEEIFRHYRWGVRPLVTSEDRRINGTQRSASVKQQWISEESNVILCFQLADLDHRFFFLFLFHKWFCARKLVSDIMWRSKESVLQSESLSAPTLLWLWENVPPF